MQQIRFGILGLGAIGHKYLASFSAAETPHATLTAVCTRRALAKAEQADLNNRGIETYTSFDEFLVAPNVDAILLATPHGSHPEQAIAAMRAGKSVLTEKPAGIYLSEVREMQAVSEELGKPFSIMFQLRTDPYFAKIREMVQSGELGRIKSVSWTSTQLYRDDAYYRSGAWRSTWAGAGGGLLVNQASHRLDLITWIFGLPQSVFAQIGYGKYHEGLEIDDDAAALFTYPDGMTCTFRSSTGEAPGTKRIEIAADLGKLVFENQTLTFYRLPLAEPQLRRQGELNIDLPIEYSTEIIPVEDAPPAIAKIIENYACHLLTGEPMIAPGESARDSMILSSAMYLSDWTQRKINLPLAEAEFDRLLREKRQA